MWHRVFATTDEAPSPADIQTRLRDLGFDQPLAVTGDDLGWTSLQVALPARTLRIERYLTDADNLRGELNTWAAWVESRLDSASALDLMQRLISTRQLLTLTGPASDALARFLAEKTDGMIQSDGIGFLAADGNVLLPE